MRVIANDKTNTHKIQEEEFNPNQFRNSSRNNHDNNKYNHNSDTYDIVMGILYFTTSNSFYNERKLFLGVLGRVKLT